jgi:hypothetical protein
MVPPFPCLIATRFVDDPYCRRIWFQARKVLSCYPAKRFVPPSARLFLPPWRFAAARLKLKAPGKADAERRGALVQANTLSKPLDVANVTTPGSEATQTRYRFGSFR